MTSGIIYGELWISEHRLGSADEYYGCDKAKANDIETC
jgi:hypothetical protein